MTRQNLFFSSLIIAMIITNIFLFNARMEQWEEEYGEVYPAPVGGVRQ